MCPYRAEHECRFYVRRHEPSSLVIAGVGFELVALEGGGGKLMRMLAGTLAASCPFISREGPV